LAIAHHFREKNVMHRYARPGWTWPLLILAVPCVAGADHGHGPALPPAAIAEINAQMHQRVVEERHAPGIVTLIAQHGRRLDLDAYGVADVETRAPMRADAVVAVASMTKPVTGVAMMMLYEQGRWRLDDPVAKFIPEFADLKVLQNDGKLVPPVHAPTMRELMSHSAGFTYGIFGDTPVDKMYLQANVLDPDSSLKTMIGKLAHLPLKHQPGTHWEYSVSVDIQGYILERLSGMPYDAFVRERILKPLHMKDSDFAVLGAARERLAYSHRPGPNGALVLALPPGGRAAVAKQIPGLPSPGGGLYSTAPDYARFCQMLLNGGVLDGVRLLKPETVALMHRNVLPPGVFAEVSNVKGGTGFGLDVAIAPSPEESGEPLPAGSYYWLGIQGTYFWIDPGNDLVVVGTMQRAWVPGVDPPSAYEPFYARSVAVRAVYAKLGH
jgi:CubicO group peptidase (beta-lactamase class C family)